VNSQLSFVGSSERELERESLVWKKAMCGLSAIETERLIFLLNDHCDNLDQTKFNVELIRKNCLSGL
jgi:hypothetical protein